MPAKEWAPKIDAEGIKKAIEKTGFSRKSVAQRLGITIGAIDKWISNGKIPVDQLAKIEELARINQSVIEATGTITVGTSPLNSVITPRHESVEGLGKGKFVAQGGDHTVEALLVAALEKMGYEVFLRKKPSG